ncbi:pyridoxal phosphate-dependent transferase [Cantharellus anzutake]|uniref:pyridoxal phosphate-dependent transferase n=1 Tax=Cantharellus anzutake TaxID=1750568 RepID=UPI0019044ED6|nr:pyridoxal phosphate-dependent transferase [Cantharellus anzutake]KAF8328123.1 pyridoxal phosphate-dependent transferase [Cantharellus anzutake]
MGLLYRNLRIYQLFGANTDVGKTIFATALVRGAAARIKHLESEAPNPEIAPSGVYYLKPCSTGPPDEADDRHVKRFSGPHHSSIYTSCLYQLQDPVSPHLAVKMANARQAAVSRGRPVDEFIKRISTHVREVASQSGPFSWLFVETAGGVHSPSLSGTPQADAYRPLFLPTLLVGDSRLGGISSTISAYESLTLRGYMIEAILVFKDEYYKNWEYLKEYFENGKGREKVDVFSVPSPPPRSDILSKDVTLLDKHYAELADEPSPSSPMSDLLKSLDTKHIARLEKLESMPQRSIDALWWPFLQHEGLRKSDIAIIDSAHGDFMSMAQPFSPPLRGAWKSHIPSFFEQRFDGSASWWTQAVGHAHPSLALAAARASGRYGHVIFPSATHEPALQLAERLLHRGPGAGWADKVFFSDNGSTAAEVALKMAMRAAALRYEKLKKNGPWKGKEMHVIGISGSYHGDTIGAMDACEGGVYNSSVEWHRERGSWIQPPKVAIRNGKLVIALPSSFRQGAGRFFFDISQSRVDSPITKLYLESIRTTLTSLALGHGSFGALLIEPLVMGAGGMTFVDPLFQRLLITTVRSEWPLLSDFKRNASIEFSEEWHGLPVIFDEVFVGFYRLGFLRASDILGVEPDISIHAKTLTGGVVPLSVTLARQSIYNAFLGDTKPQALLHGHSYTAHPVGCAIANASLDLIEDIVSNSKDWKEARTRWSSRSDPRPPEVRGGIMESCEPKVWSLWDPGFVTELSCRPQIREVMTLGTVLAFRLHDPQSSDESFTRGYQATSAEHFMQGVRRAMKDDGADSQYTMHYRTLGDVGYVMCSLNTPPRVLRNIEKAISRTSLRWC